MYRKALFFVALVYLLFHITVLGSMYRVSKATYVEEFNKSQNGVQVIEEMFDRNAKQLTISNWSTLIIFALFLLATFIPDNSKKKQIERSSEEDSTK